MVKLGFWLCNNLKIKNKKIKSKYLKKKSNKKINYNKKYKI